MAQLPVPTAETPDTLPVPSGAIKNDAQLTASLSDFLRRYHPPAAERQPDMIEGRYQIDLSKPLPEFNSKNAHAYAASDNIDPGKALFALVCHPGTLQRNRIIPQLKGLNHPNLLTLVAADVVMLSQPHEERFVLLYRRPPGRKLSQMLTELQVPLNEHFISRNIIAPIASAIQQLSELNVVHGSIRPENIYFGETPVLGDCIAEPCGYTQPFYYEPLERMQCLQAGKGDGDTSQDFYALAVVVLYILYGPNHFAGLTAPQLARQILQEGVYNALLRQRESVETCNDFLRGMLCLNSKDRWTDQNVKQWLEGRRQNVPVQSLYIEAVRPFDFGEASANTRRELAHLFYTDWKNIPQALHHNHLIHWVSVSLRNKELAESISRIARTIAEVGSRNEVQTNEQLMRLIVLLDPEGPIRMGPLAFNLDGIDSLSAELFFTKAEKDFHTLARFIEFNMGNFWLEQRREDPEYVVPATISTTMARLERLRVCIRNTGFGFGLERVLYDMNPDLPCLSPLFAGWHIRNLPNLLTRLNQLAPTLAFKDQDPIDRHIAAYIASKLGLQHEIKLHELDANSTLAANRSIIALKILAMAQERASDLNLAGITHWLALRILPALDQINSKSLRQKIKSVLIERADAGSLSRMADLVIGSGYASIDQDGFSAARSTYQSSKEKIRNYRTVAVIEENSSSTGFVLAKSFAYIAFLITLMNVIHGG